MRHVNIPVFIPHLGCPNNCVFCNQKRISGTTSFDITKTDELIKTALSTLDENCETEIAFFGGSFTGIPRDDMVYLLETAYKYIRSGKVNSIRLSTRPDYIDREILDILKKYGVKTIELGLQSLDDNVLRLSKRGHTASQAVSACKLIKQYGFVLIGQMMIGLPGSDLEKELYTSEIISENCDGARIYPTVVFKESELYDMALSGVYTPLELDDCIMRTGECLEIFAKKDKPVIRIGLQSSDNLFDSDVVYKSDYHSSIGEMAENYLYHKKICTLLEDKKTETEGKTLFVYCSKGSVSKVIGQHKINKIKIISKFKLKNLKVVEKDNIIGYNIELDIL